MTQIDAALRYNEDDSIDLDGSRWVLEGVWGDAHHVIDRPCVPNKDGSDGSEFLAASLRAWIAPT